MMNELYNTYKMMMSEIDKLNPLFPHRDITPNELMLLNNNISKQCDECSQVIDSCHIDLQTIKMIQMMLSSATKFVYFIKNAKTGLIKIGKTSNLNQRIAQIKGIARQLGIEEHQLCYVAIICCPNVDVVSADYLERFFHSLFVNQRKIGEWFDIQEDDVTNLLYGYFDCSYRIKDESNNEIHIANAFNSDCIKQLSADMNTEKLSCSFTQHDNIYNSIMENIKTLYYIEAITKLIENNVLQSTNDFNEFVDRIIFVPVLRSLYNCKDKDISVNYLHDMRML